MINIKITHKLNISKAHCLLKIHDYLISNSRFYFFYAI